MDFESNLPGNIKSLKAYVAGKTISEVEKYYKPKQISKLASNENRLGCSHKVREAVLNCLAEIQDYPDPIASELRKKIAKQNGVNENEVLLAAGSESLISIICRTFFKDNEHAITANATFVGFFVQAGVRGIEVKRVPVDADYNFDVDAILNSVTPDTKMVYIANPNNPTGTFISKQKFQKLINGLPDHVFLIADEAYHEYAVHNPDYPKAMDYRRDNVIILRTFSKAYGLAGFRIGYAIAHERAISEMSKVKLTFEPTTPAQVAAITALDDQEFIRNSVDMVVEGREDLYRFFDEHSIRYLKSNANSVMMILENEKDAIDFTDGMLKEGVILRRVNAFGLPNCIRITIGQQKEMEHFKRSFLEVMEASIN
ncbi:MAG: histidinol-phosphate transaminase [Balneolaceae bacterium]